MRLSRVLSSKASTRSKGFGAPLPPFLRTARPTFKSWTATSANLRQSAWDSHPWTLRTTNRENASVKSATTAVRWQESCSQTACAKTKNNSCLFLNLPLLLLCSVSQKVKIYEDSTAIYETRTNVAGNLEERRKNTAVVSGFCRAFSFIDRLCANSPPPPPQ